MAFTDLMRDTITVIKKDGTEIPNLRASVQGGKKIFTQSGNFQVEVGDKIQRYMSNGGVETFEVLEPNFIEGAVSIPAHYQMSVRNVNSQDKSNRSILHIHGDNSRVYQNSTDNSTNHYGIRKEDLIIILDKIKAEVANINDQSEEKPIANLAIKKIEEELQKDKPNRSVLEALTELIPSVGAVATLTTQLIGMLPT